MTNEDTGRSKADSAEEFAEKPLQNLSFALPRSADVPEIQLRGPTHMEVFWAWERLRLIFNLLLISLVLAMCLRREFSILTGVFFLPHALIANLGFCAGSVFEGYATAIGVPRSVSRPVIFCCGFLFTAMTALSTVPTELRHLDR